MDLEIRLNALYRLSSILHPENESLQSIVEKAYQHNRWFTPDNIFLMLKNIREQFLQENKLSEWLSRYSFQNNTLPKTVGIVMAGNIPLAGFHDFLCVFLSGHKSMIKLSSKDDVLFPFLLSILFEKEEELKQWITISDLLKGMDAVIATGSNNTSRYFKYYFGKYPHIIRKNRSSVAVLTGKEPASDILKLGTDIFSYFGLGCRNVSKLMVPENYSFNFFFECVEPFRYVADHNKYKNNYDYNRTLLIMNGISHLSNDFIMVKEDRQLVSPIAELFFEYYTGEERLKERLSEEKSFIQCIVGNFPGSQKNVPFGQSQSPELWDYADGIDTMSFLETL